MFLVRWIRLLLSLPVLWLGRLGVMFDVRGGVELIKAAYAIGQDPATAILALSYVRKYQGDEGLLAQARAWCDRRVRPEIAGLAGAVEILGPGRVEQAREWQAMAISTGEDDPYGNVDFLRLMVATDKDEALRVAEEVIAGGKCNPLTTQTALTWLAYEALAGGRWGEARQRAEHLLAVSKYPPAIIVLWALASRSGEEKRAQALLRKIETVPWPQRLQPWVEANRAIGRAEEADRALAEHAPAPADPWAEDTA